MRSNYIKIILFFSVFSTSIVGQSDTTIVKKRPLKTESYFRFNYDNDFFSATDRYYTQGISLELIMPFIKKSPLSKLLIPINKNALNYYGINFEQDGFTPRSIRHDSIFFGERPYASVFFVSHFLISINAEKKQRLSTSLDLGIIGPEAKGEEEQKGIHHALKNIQPLGWEYQIASDYVVNYNVKFEQGVYLKKQIECIGFVSSRLGTLYDDISIGAMIRTGSMQSYFKNLGMSPTSYKGDQNGSEERTNKFQCYVFGKAELKTVAYNATMQGGMFNKNSIYTIPSKDIKRLVGALSGGIVLAYKRVSLEYTKVYLGPEFKNGLSHAWGHCCITVCF
ncbi:MAG: lipid A deacylase LpxR family protein [Bacteroidota bacterium]